MRQNILSVGHSNHSFDYFDSLLRRHRVEVLIDVRKSPKSRFAHFNQYDLMSRLNAAEIGYLHLGDTLGGRDLNGPAFSETARATPFLNGVSHLLSIAERCKVAIMCAEHEPLNCHRFLLIGRHLAERGDVDVAHILRDGSLEAHEETEQRLLKLAQLGTDLFADRAAALDLAYARQEARFHGA